MNHPSVNRTWGHFLIVLVNTTHGSSIVSDLQFSKRAHGVSGRKP
jgi:hypothetical protein